MRTATDIPSVLSSRVPLRSPVHSCGSRASLPLQLPLVKDPNFGALDDQEGKGQDNKEQSPGQRRRVSELELLKSLSIEVEYQGERRVVRPALGHDIGKGEHLKGPDDAHDDAEEYRRRQHGDRHCPETTPGTGAIDRGGLVESRGDGLQASQEEEHRAPGSPDAHDDERGNRRALSEDPLDARNDAEDTHLIQQAVNESIVRVIEPGP